MNDPLLKMIQEHKQGSPVGQYSVCSANPFVVEASIQQALQDQSPLLVESTSNQVDQFGGYSGMTPADFVSFIKNLCKQRDFPSERLIIGGDHLGPNRWQKEPAESAMPKAHELIRSSIRSGYTKIHLDTSMRLQDDPGDQNAPLAVETVARRAAELCKTAEITAAEFPGKTRPLYVIGTDVPPPGGARETPGRIHVTSVPEAEQTVEVTRKAFQDLDLQEAWERVIAVVVQPGVEFGETTVFDYQPDQARKLSEFIERQSGLLYEAHSTDYQKPENLARMVADHFAILKVGPWLTYAFREAVFALAFIEKEWLGYRKDIQLSHLMELVEQTMVDKPQYWRNHYHGTEDELILARRYSLSDRIRYYWPQHQVQSALKKLIENLSVRPIPVTLLSQFLPEVVQVVREKQILNQPLAIIHYKIREVTGHYSTACRKGGRAAESVHTTPV